MKNNQAHATTAEVGEGRELAKGNAGQQNRVRTQCRAECAKRAGSRAPRGDHPVEDEVAARIERARVERADS